MKITVVGLGHVGIVAAAGLAIAGHDVLGVDVDSERAALLQDGRLPFYEPGLPERLKRVYRSESIRVLRANDVDEDLGNVALIAVGRRPLGGEADAEPVVDAVRWVLAQRHENLVIVNKSTVPPGMGRRLIEEELGNAGVSYVANPEFLREGQALSDWDRPDRIVLGVESGSNRALETVQVMYSQIDAPFLVTDTTSAEMIKLASNAFLATRISFINEIAALCDSVGASIDDVSRGVALDARMGTQVFAGAGYGGSCLPSDVESLVTLGSELESSTGFLKSVQQVNQKQRLLPVQVLKERFGGDLAGVRVAVLGLSFKPDTDDVRDAPSLHLIRALSESGAIVTAYDPAAVAAATAHLPESVHKAESITEAAERAQALILMTEWEEIVNCDWRVVAAAMALPRLVIDGRNALDRDKLSALGFDYIGVGRGKIGDNLPAASREQSE